MSSSGSEDTAGSWGGGGLAAAPAKGVERPTNFEALLSWEHCVTQ